MYVFYSANNVHSNAWEEVYKIIQQDMLSKKFWIPIYGRNSIPGGMTFEVYVTLPPEKIEKFFDCSVSNENYKPRIVIETEGKIEGHGIEIPDKHAVVTRISLLNKNGQVETLHLQNESTRKKLIGYMEKSAFPYSKRKRCESEGLTDFWKGSKPTGLSRCVGGIIDYILESDLKDLSSENKGLVDSVKSFCEEILKNNFATLRGGNKGTFEGLKGNVGSAVQALTKTTFAAADRENARLKNLTFLSGLYQKLDNKDLVSHPVKDEHGKGFEIPKTPQPEESAEPSSKRRAVGETLRKALFGRGAGR